jgi:hypothetical protein
MRAPVLALLGIFVAAAHIGAQGGAVRFALRDESPYAFNYGRIESRTGFGPRTELYGTNLAGDRRLLFVSEYAAGLFLDFAVYNDGTLFALELAGTDAQGRALSAGHTLRIQSVPEHELRQLGLLRFSYGSYPGLKDPAPEGLEKADAEYLSRRINAAYFSPRASYPAALLLAAWALAALIAAPLVSVQRSAGMRPAGAASLALALAIALGLTLSLIMLAAFGPRPQLLVMEGAETGGFVEEMGQRRLDGYGERRWRAYGGLEGGPEEAAASAAQAAVAPAALSATLPAADYLGLRSPRGAALPLSALEGYRYLLFSDLPLIVADAGGALRIGGGPYLAAWGIRR